MREHYPGRRFPRYRDPRDRSSRTVPPTFMWCIDADDATNGRFDHIKDRRTRELLIKWAEEIESSAPREVVVVQTSPWDVR